MHKTTATLLALTAFIAGGVVGYLIATSTGPVISQIKTPIPQEATVGTGKSASPTGMVAGTSNTMEADGTVSNIIQANMDFSILQRAITIADFDDKLQDNGPYTVFAPTNAGFNDIDSAVINDLLRPENAVQLQDLLENHIVMGTYRLDDLTDGLKLQTLNGDTLTIRRENNQVLINDIAVILLPNQEGTNGIVHGISTVITTGPRPTVTGVL